jgi:hypothetical protein
VIGYCKAAEVESVTRLLTPLRRELNTAASTEDLADRAISTVARFCGGDGNPPALGSLRFFLEAAANSKRRVQTSATLQAFLRVAARWAGREWILGREGAAGVLEQLTTRYRNTAAHTGELRYTDFLGCRELVVGANGFLPKLIAATQLTAAPEVTD